MGLPPLFDAWANDLLGASPPEESQATCDDCAMCKRPGDQASTLGFYDPRAKCCTYSPYLNNFLVGRILREADPAMAFGVRTVAERVALGVAVTPLGLGPTPQRKLLYSLGAKVLFGRSLELRCPYYAADSGGCGIWKHRNAVCSTYFCKYDRGAVGMRFWSAANALLAVVSDELAVHCALELGLDDAATRHLAAIPSGAPTAPAAFDQREIDGGRAEDYDQRWGAWQGREAEFFIACARIVDGTSWKDALAVAGARGRLAAAAVTNAYRALGSDALPEPLRSGRFHVRFDGSGTVAIEAYNGGDELAAPKVILDILPYFDGSPIETVLARIAEETGVAVERAFIAKLVDFEILVPAS